jgi:hypothetical protein
MTTHDTALRERLQYTADAPGGAYKAAAIAALEAVLELHKPSTEHAHSDGYLECSHCWDGADYCPAHDPWPCETVLAVAEALGVDLSA